MGKASRRSAEKRIMLEREHENERDQMRAAGVPINEMESAVGAAGVILEIEGVGNFSGVLMGFSSRPGENEISAVEISMNPMRKAKE